MTGQNSARRFDKAVPLTTCDACGKLTFGSRKAAKLAARARGGGPWSVYSCQLAPEHEQPRWHYGHPPRELTRGITARADVIANRTIRLRR